jgi:hypothetical protein
VERAYYVIVHTARRPFFLQSVVVNIIQGVFGLILIPGIAPLDFPQQNVIPEVA